MGFGRFPLPAFRLAPTIVPMAKTERLKLPGHFQLEPELLEQLSSRPGHQRCVEGAGELLLVVHEVPKPRVPEREAIFFWKRHDGSWFQSGGPGLGELSGLLDRFEKTIDAHEEKVDVVEEADELFQILRHSGPLARSTRNMVLALDQVLAIDPDDREIRGLRDRACELDRAADLLNNDGRMALDFWRAERAEEHALAGARLNRIAFRLNLLAGFFLPLVALGGLFGMNVNLPAFIKSMFWIIVFAGLGFGGILLYFVGRNTGRGSDFDEEFPDDDDDDNHRARSPIHR